MADAQWKSDLAGCLSEDEGSEELKVVILLSFHLFFTYVIQAAGWNAISVYHHWGLSEGKQGDLNFDYYRSHTDVYEVAKEVGILVVSRPGVSLYFPSPPPS